MYRELSRLLFPLLVAMSGIAVMTALSHAPTACATEAARQCARVAPVAIPGSLPAEPLAGTRTSRPLRVSLPDFLNLGAAPGRRNANVIK